MAPARQATGSMDAGKEESEEEQKTSDEEVWCSGVTFFLGGAMTKTK